MPCCSSGTKVLASAKASQIMHSNACTFVIAGTQPRCWSIHTLCEFNDLWGIRTKWSAVISSRTIFSRVGQSSSDLGTVIGVRVNVEFSSGCMLFARNLRTPCERGSGASECDFSERHCWSVAVGVTKEACRSRLILKPRRLTMFALAGCVPWATQAGSRRLYSVQCKS